MMPNETMILYLLVVLVVIALATALLYGDKL